MGVSNRVAVICVLLIILTADAARFARADDQINSKTQGESVNNNNNADSDAQAQNPSDGHAEQLTRYCFMLLFSLLSV